MYFIVSIIIVIAVAIYIKSNYKSVIDQKISVEQEEIEDLSIINSRNIEIYNQAEIEEKSNSGLKLEVNNHKNFITTNQVKVNDYIKHKFFGVGKIINKNGDVLEIIFLKNGYRRLSNEICTNRHLIDQVDQKTSIAYNDCSIFNQVLSDEIDKKRKMDLKAKKEEIRENSSGKSGRSVHSYERETYNYNLYNRGGHKYFNRVKRR